jgi:hypothetical protein
MNAEQIHRLSQGIDEGNGAQHYNLEQIQIIDKFLNQGGSPNIDALINNFFIGSLRRDKQPLEVFTIFCIEDILEGLIPPLNRDIINRVRNITDIIKTKPESIKYRLFNKILDDRDSGELNQQMTVEKINELLEKYKQIINLTEGGRRRKKSTRKRSNKKNRSGKKDRSSVRRGRR